MQANITAVPKRAGDLILHHLFTCIDKDNSNKIFRDCWPLHDKKCEAQFYRAAFDWYKALDQKYSGAKTSMIVSRAVVNPSSAKFTSTIHNLTKIALKSQINNFEPNNVLLDEPKSGNHIHNKLSSEHILSMSLAEHDKFTSIQQKSQAALSSASVLSRKLLVDYRASNRECESLRKDVQTLASDLVPKIPSLKSTNIQELVSADLTLVQKIVDPILESLTLECRKEWKTVMNLKTVHDECWELLEPLVQATSKLNSLDIESINPTIPPNTINLLLHKGYHLPSLYEEGPEGSILNFGAVLQTATLCLHALLHQAKQVYTGYDSSDESVLDINQQKSLSISESVLELERDTIQVLTKLRADVARILSTIDFSCDQDLPAPICPPTPPLHRLKDSCVSPCNATNPLQATPG